MEKIEADCIPIGNFVQNIYNVIYSKSSSPVKDIFVE